MNMNIPSVTPAQFHAAVNKAAIRRRQDKDAGTTALLGDLSHPGVFQQLMTGSKRKLLEVVYDAWKNRISQEEVNSVNGLIDINKFGLRQTEEAVVDEPLVGYIGYGTKNRIPRNLNARTEEKRKIYIARKKHEEEQFEKKTKEDPYVRAWMKKLHLDINDLLMPVHNQHEIDRSGGQRIKAEILHRAADGGLFNTPFPEEYGGYNFNQQMTDLIIEFLPELGGGLAAAIKVQQSLGGKLLIAFATESQKAHFIPELLPHDKKERGLISFLLTEEASGSDAFGSMQSEARLSDDGKNFIVDVPSKKFITCFHVSKLGHLAVNIIDKVTGAKLPTVLEWKLPFRFDDTKEIMEQKIDALWNEGFEMPYNPQGLNGIIGSMQLYGEGHGYKGIPLQYVPGVLSILGGLDGIGRGDEYSTGGLYKGRGGFIRLSAANAALGFNLALDETVNEDRIRFKKTLSANELVKTQIGDMAIKVEMLRAYAELTSTIIDNNKKMNFVPETAIGKAFATDTANSIIQTANFLFGGQGLMKGQLIEQAVRDHRVLLTVEGVNPLMYQLGAGASVGPALAAKTFSEKARIALSQFMLPMNEFKLGLRGAALSISTLIKGARYQMAMRERQNDLMDISHEEAMIFAILASKLKLKDLRMDTGRNKKEIAALNGFLQIANGEKPNLVGIGQLYIDDAKIRYQHRKREDEELVRKYS